MPQKKPRWNKCTKGVIQYWPTAEVLAIGSHVKVGMRVSAQYGKSIVVLEITESIQNNDYKAKIECFEPININPPDDLEEGEIVLINRDDICWILS